MTDKGKNNGGFLEGLTNLLGALGDLAEKGDQLEKLKEMQTKDGQRFRVHSNFRVGSLDGSGGTTPGSNMSTPTPFERPGRADDEPAQAGRGNMAEVREPNIDIFEEADHVLVIAELPGVSELDATISVDGDVLTITAKNAIKHYHAETLLPTTPESGSMTVASNNGVFEIRFEKTGRRSA